MEVINLIIEEDKKEVKIGIALQDANKEKMTKLLHEYMDVFVWSYQDMLGLDIDIFMHKLPLREECPPVKQKLTRN